MRGDERGRLNEAPSGTLKTELSPVGQREWAGQAGRSLRPTVDLRPEGSGEPLAPLNQGVTVRIVSERGNCGGDTKSGRLAGDAGDRHATWGLRPRLQRGRS